MSSTISYGGGETSGGYTTPDKAYVVGENGPEILAGANARVYSNSESTRMLGGGNGGSGLSIGYIDARGTDANAVAERTSRAIEYSQKASVQSAVKVQREKSMRTPTRRAAYA